MRACVCWRGRDHDSILLPHADLASYVANQNCTISKGCRGWVHTSAEYSHKNFNTSHSIDGGRNTQCSLVVDVLPTRRYSINSTRYSITRGKAGSSDEQRCASQLVAKGGGENNLLKHRETKSFKQASVKQTTANKPKQQTKKQTNNIKLTK